ncbi:hypothetical protein BJX64DRAFT_277287 [Aspergillus heterothallicus]
MTTQQQTPPHAVDAAKLAATRKRYADEANKRLRPEGTAQFLPVTQAEGSRLRSLADDPWVDHAALNATPAPIESGATYRFFVLGAGFGGLQFAVRLLNEGLATVDEIRLADAAGGFGGTWYWNRFPGLHCDIESYVYLPLLEETGYVPSHKYAPAAEIREHAERIAERWDLRPRTLFRTDVESTVWDEASQLWMVKAIEHRGPDAAPILHVFRAQYVYLAAGVLTRPQVPKIPGLPSFGGEFFHTARWNYNISGGSQGDQTLTGLKGKKVAVIGTAATAIAVIPEVAKYADELYVIQRTPAYVKARNQRPTKLEEFHTRVAGGKKGWQYERQLNLNAWMTNSAAPGVENLVNDGWTDMPAYSAILGSRRHGIIDSSSPEKIEQHIDAFHAQDFPHMESVRARVEAVVKDPATAEKLKPWYPSWCKRPTFSDVYLQTFNRRNVHLVDTDGKGPETITPRGIVVAGKEYPVDIIIFSTGYRAVTGNGSPSARTGVDIIGRGAQSLDAKWAAQGAATLHGYASSGFPNLFFSGTNQATITGNNIFMLGLIAKHVIHWIHESEKSVGPEKRAIIEVTKEAEEAHTAEILKRAPYFAALGGCTPGYFNSYGEANAITDPDEKVKRAKGSTWSEGARSFLDYIEAWRHEGSLNGLSVKPARALKALL